MARVSWAPTPVDRVLDAPAAAGPADSASFWLVAAQRPRLAAYALRRLALLAETAGDSARADSLWLALARRPGLWQWEALRAHSDRLISRGERAAAESLLAAATDRTGWSEIERAAWLARRMSLAAALGDTARAIDFGRQIVRRYPALGPAAQGLRLLEDLLAARGQGLTSSDLEAAGEVAFFRSERDPAARRMRAALALAPPERKWRIGLRLGVMLRAARQHAGGLAAIAEAAARAPDADARARCAIERARLLRDSKQPEQAFAAWRSAAALAQDPTLRALAHWERALEQESRARWADARASYAAAAAAHGPRSADAQFRSGLLWLAEGRRDSALAAWRGATSEAVEFWRAILGRGAGDANADSALAVLAARPGYGFHRMAARETLHTRGWPGEVAIDRCEVAAACADLDLAEDLLVLGATQDAMFVLQRWSYVTNGAAATGDPGAAPALAAPAGAALRAARIAFAAGRVPTGIRLAQKALDAVPSSDAGGSWAVVPWSFPPALDSLYDSRPLAAFGDSLDRALLRAIAWQESKFDPAARSRSNALGLYQLKLATAGDVARWLKERPPTEFSLQDPVTSIRYGESYFRWLLRRTDGRHAVAIAAYNAGPSGIAPHWRELVARGGEALFVEMIDRPETRDYARKVLAARQAYRELQPHVERP